MDCLHDADRRSLLMEIQVLHAQMNSMKNNPKREQEIDSKSQGDFNGISYIFSCHCCSNCKWRTVDFFCSLILMLNLRSEHTYFLFFNLIGVTFQKFKYQLCSYDLCHKWHKIVSTAIKIEYFKIIFCAFWTFPSWVVNQEEERTTKSSESNCTLNSSCKCFQCFVTNIWSKVCVRSYQMIGTNVVVQMVFKSFEELKWFLGKVEVFSSAEDRFVFAPLFKENVFWKYHCDSLVLIRCAVGNWTQMNGVVWLLD